MLFAQGFKSTLNIGNVDDFRLGEKRLTYGILAGLALASLVIIVLVAFASLTGTLSLSSSSQGQPVAPVAKNSVLLDGRLFQAVSSPAQSGRFFTVGTGGQSFDAQGEIDSVTDITESLSYDLQGSWNMQVRGGNVVQFEVNMDAVPSDATLGNVHTHQLLNYVANRVGLLDSDDNNFFTSGKVDVGTNNKLSWQDVPVVITFRDGDTITITLDDTKAGHHFAGQPLTGTIESITPCSEGTGTTGSDEDPCQADDGTQGDDDAQDDGNADDETAG